MGNSPTNATDPSGEFGILGAVVVGAAVGAVAGAVTSAVVQTVENGGDITAIDSSDVAAAAVSGAGAVGLGIAANTLQYGLSQWWNEESLTWGGATSSAVTGAIGGRIGGPVTRYRNTWYEDWGLGGEFFSWNVKWEIRRGEVMQAVAGATSARNILASLVSSINVAASTPGMVTDGRK